MFLKNLKLTNFRNYRNLDLTFDNRPTILLGDNAAGKSNLLEAVYVLSTTKSQRVEKEEELILVDEDFTKVEGVVSDNSNETSLVVIIQRKAGSGVQPVKRVLVNGVSRRVVDFVGLLPAVIFYPADINMVTGSPSLRRWHLDLALAQIDQEYKRALTSYEQFLTARNRVLKRIREGLSRQDELWYWTEELIKSGEVVSRKRKLFFEFINSIDHPLGNFSFNFDANLLTKERLKQYRDSEISAATTLIGPHRDDFSFYLKDRNLAHFGSRGEQRTATLAFKLSQLEFMAQIYGSRPVLLLDDIFSELDASHRGKILEIIPKQQTIVATVELENIPKEFLDSSRVLKVEKGQVIF
ncbi:MAG: DNA replication/repair protein RecF [Patescibacteria group bacterium]|nr:DNA replication/repair protein RecF [Patescibacteria group bacterium]